MQQRSAHIADHSGKLEWPLTDTHERVSDIAEEFLGETGSLSAMPGAVPTTSKRLRNGCHAERHAENDGF